MKMTRRDFLRLSSAAAAACGVTLLPAQKADAASEIQTLLEEAYLYAFPLVLVDATKTVSTNAKTPSANRARQPVHPRPEAAGRFQPHRRQPQCGHHLHAGMAGRQRRAANLRRAGDRPLL